MFFFKTSASANYDKKFYDFSIESITGETINFKDRTVNIDNEILSIYDRIISVDDITGKVFRLYSSILDRFPDIKGFEYWIEKHKQGEVDYDEIVKSFISSEEYHLSKNKIDGNETALNTFYQRIFDFISCKYCCHVISARISIA